MSGKLWDYTKAFGRFWYGFIIGDDWSLAAAVAIGIAAELTLHYLSIVEWYILPILVLLAVGVSIGRGAYSKG